MKKKSVIIIVVVAACFIFVGFAALVFVISLSGPGAEWDFHAFGSRVAVVELYGEIISSSDFVRQVRRWTEDGSVKAIVVDIDSPGGGVAASQEMYDQLIKAREEGVIVVASMRSVAASGGYYVACAADKIVANPGTLTGSIGVILSFPTARKLLDKIGLQWETVQSGDLKGVGDFTRPMTPEEERMLKAVIDDTYQQFVEAVAEGRDKPKEEIYPLADGAIFTGRQAYNLGMVDTLGTFEDAVSLAGIMADLGPDPDRIKERKRQATFLDLLTTGSKLLEKISDMESNQAVLKYRMP